MENNRTPEERANVARLREKRRMKARKKKRALILRVFLFMFLLVFLILGMVLAMKYTPTRERMELSEYYQIKDNEIATILDGEYLKTDSGEYNAYNYNGAVYLALDFVKKNLDDGYVYDYTENILRYVTDKEVYTAELNHPEYLIDRAQAVLEHNIVIVENNTVFLAIDYVDKLTDITYNFQENPNRISINKAGYTKNTAEVKKDTQARRKAGVKSPILADLTQGEKVEILDVIDTWSVVLTQDNVIGCVQSKKLINNSTETIEASLPERVYKHNLVDFKINMGWQQITNKSQNKDISKTLAKATGVNVMSPTWFVVSSEQGDLSSDASADYVSYCHSKGVQVWPTVNNIEMKDQVDTATLLNVTSNRDALVNNLIATAIKLDLDGINVDFESVGKDAKDGYIEFIRELSLKCKNNNIILSVDNYVPTEFTAHYNRAEQAKYADYIIIMGYDEHYVGGPEAGSTASKNFVKDGIENTLKVVPKEQTVLGMPFYCRLWCTKPDGTLTSTAYGLVGAKEHIQYKQQATKTWDEETGQNYVEYKSGDDLYQMWLEDETSLEWKLKFLNDYNLAGGAFWRLGFEDDATWNLVSKYL